MTVDYTAWRFWMDAGNYVATVAIGLYVWWDKRKVKTVKRFLDLEKWKNEQGPRIESLTTGMAELKTQCAGHIQQTNQLDKKHLQIEADFRSLPTREDLTKLSDQMNALSVNLGKANGRLSGIGRAVDLMNQHLLKVGE